jgi:hypothetical protein
MIKGSYCDLKFIRTRSVVQVVIELPIEAADVFLREFGAPVQARECPVTIVKGTPNDAKVRQGVQEAVREAIDDGPAKKVAAKRAGTAKKLEDLPLVQQAGIICNEPAFWKYFGELLGHPVGDAEGCAVALREVCEVGSRRELMTNEVAAMRFRTLRDQYQAWRLVG